MSCGGSYRAPVSLLLSLPLLLTACKDPIAAPTEMSDLSIWLFANFESDDPALPEAMANLQTFLAGLDLSGSYGDRSYDIAPLAEEHIADVQHPDTDLVYTFTLGMVAESAFTPAQHTQVHILEDQTPVEPTSPNLYQREFLEPADPSCYPDRGCDGIRTMNDIIKENVFSTIPYEMNKDYRWVDFELDGQPVAGILARSWVQEESFGEGGQSRMPHSYTLDVSLPHGESGSIRWLVLWALVEIDGISQESIAGTTKYGMNKLQQATEEWLEDYYDAR